MLTIAACGPKEERLLPLERFSLQDRQDVFSIDIAVAQRLSSNSAVVGI
jgi:hypothetical protein